MAVVAPTPSAIVSAATMVKVGAWCQPLELAGELCPKRFGILGGDFVDRGVLHVRRRRECGGRIEVAIFLKECVDLRESLVVSHNGPLYPVGARLRNSARIGRLAGSTGMNPGT